MRTSLRLMTITFVISLLLVACGGEPEPETFTVGIIVTRPGSDPISEGFISGMTEAGYIEGENITYIREQTTNEIEDIEAIVERLKEQNVDLILSRGTTLSVNLRGVMEETDAPVVFVPVHDPVRLGLVESITHPGANFTGVFSSRLTDKRLEWFLKVSPDTSHIFAITATDDANIIEEAEVLKEAADEQGVTLIMVEANSPEDIPTLLNDIPDEVDAIYILPASLFHTYLPLYIEVALEHRLPLMASQGIENGTLLSFGTDELGFGLQASRMAEQILQGVPPSDIPVEEADAFLTINVQTANTIGLDIPSEVLDQADTIVRETIFIDEFEVEADHGHGHANEQDHGD